MTLLLGADPPHAVQLRSVSRVAVEELVEVRVLEDQGAAVAVHLDREVARPPDRDARHLEHPTGTRLEPDQSGGCVVDGHGFG